MEEWKIRISTVSTHLYYFYVPSLTWILFHYCVKSAGQYYVPRASQVLVSSGRRQATTTPHVFNIPAWLQLLLVEGLSNTFGTIRMCFNPLEQSHEFRICILNTLFPITTIFHIRVSVGQSVYLDEL